VKLLFLAQTCSFNQPSITAVEGSRGKQGRGYLAPAVSYAAYTVILGWDWGKNVHRVLGAVLAPGQDGGDNTS